MDRPELLRRWDAGQRDFSGVNWRNSQLHTLNLTNIILAGADLRGANLMDCTFDNANLESACLEGANLDGARFQEANMRRINLRKSNMYGAYINDCILDDALLEGADLRNVIISESSFRRASFGGLLTDEATGFNDTDFTQSDIGFWEIPQLRSFRITMPDGEIFSSPGEEF